MKNNKKEKTQKSDITSITLTKEHMKMIQSLAYSIQRIKLDQEALADDLKAVAEKMNVKPGEVKEIVNWVIQEQEKGGVLSSKEKKLEFARQVLSFLDGSSDSSE